jgi:hypothetical protein
VTEIESGATDTIAAMKGHDLFLYHRAGTQIGFASVPFDVPPSAAVHDNVIVITPGDTAEIRTLGADGTLQSIARISNFAEPLSSERFGAYVERLAGRASNQGDAAELRRWHSRMDPPALVPTFDELVADTEGNTWARRYRETNDEPFDWIVFSADGVVLGSIRTPDRLTISEVGRDYVLGVWRDPLDVQHVRVHRLQRSE